MGNSRTLVLTALAAVALNPITLSGQVARGQLLSGDTGTPLEGAMMVLQANGEEVGVALTNACGGEGFAPDAAVLSGVGRDGENGLPVPGASIRILWTDYRFWATDVVRPGRPAVDVRCRTSRTRDYMARPTNPVVPSPVPCPPTTRSSWRRRVKAWPQGSWPFECRRGSGFPLST